MAGLVQVINEHSEQFLPAFARLRAPAEGYSQRYSPLHFALVGSSPQAAGGERELGRWFGIGGCAFLVGEDGRPLDGAAGRTTGNATQLFHGQVELLLTDRRLLGVVTEGQTAVGEVGGGSGQLLVLVFPLERIESVGVEKRPGAFGGERESQLSIVNMEHVVSLYLDEVRPGPKRSLVEAFVAPVVVARRPSAGALEAVQLAAVERGDREDDEREYVVSFLPPNATRDELAPIRPRPSTDPAEIADRVIELLASGLPGLADADGDAPVRAVYDTVAETLRGLGEGDSFAEFAANPANRGLVRRILQGAVRDDASLAERLAAAVAAFPQERPTWHHEMTSGAAVPTAISPGIRIPAPMISQRKAPSGGVLLAAAFAAVFLFALVLTFGLPSWGSDELTGDSSCQEYLASTDVRAKTQVMKDLYLGQRKSRLAADPFIVQNTEYYCGGNPSLTLKRLATSRRES